MLFTVSISDIPTIKYWQNLVKIMDTAEDKIPKQFICGDICFTSLEKLEEIYIQDTQKTFNHVNTDSNDILLVVIILGTYAHGGEIVFFNGMDMNDIRKRAHDIKHMCGWWI